MNEENNRPSDRYPDIEIYIQQIQLPELVDWLTSRLEVSSIEEKGKSTVLMLMNSNGDDVVANGTSMACTIVPEAVKGNFTSVWITPNNTEWLTDRDFAREAHNHFSWKLAAVQVLGMVMTNKAGYESPRTANQSLIG